jgi:hypothetical protein
MTTVRAFLDGRGHRRYERITMLPDALYLLTGFLVTHWAGIVGGIMMTVFPLVRLVWTARIAVDEMGVYTRWLWFRRRIPWSQIIHVSLHTEFIGARLRINCRHGRDLHLLAWKANADRIVSLVGAKAGSGPDDTAEMAWPSWLANPSTTVAASATFSRRK